MLAHRRLGLSTIFLALVAAACGPVAIGVGLSSGSSGGGGSPPSITVISQLTATGNINASRDLLLTFVTVPAEAACEYQVDGGAWLAAPTTGEIQIRVETEGDHSFVIRQRDNSTVQATYSWFVDSVPPGVVVNASASSSRAHTLALSWAPAPDPAPTLGLTGYSVTYTVAQQSPITVITEAASIDLVDLAATRLVNVSIRAIDRAGNIGPAVPLQARVDVGGDGTFAPAAARVQNLAGISAMAYGDFNGDKIQDLVAVYGASSPSTLAVFSGNGVNGRGDGTFATTPITFGAPGQAVLAVCDFDLDRNPDIIVAGSNGMAGEVRVSRGNSSGGFTAGPVIGLPEPATSLLVADLDDDTRPDLLVGTASSGVLLFRGIIGGFAPAGTIASASRVNRSVASDLNDDRQVDVLFAADGGLFLALGTGGGAFAPPVRQLETSIPAPADLLLVDVDGDGIPDLVALAADRARVQVAFGDAAGGCAIGSFSFDAEYAVSGTIRSFATGDFDSDAVADLVVVKEGGGQASAQVLRGKVGPERGTFSIETAVTASGVAAGPVLVADFDARGTLDLLVADPAAGNINLLAGRGGLGVGDGNFVLGWEATVPDPVLAIAVDDFDRDGILDLASTQTNGSAGVYVRLGVGELGVAGGTFGQSVVLASEAWERWSLLATDLNGDRNVDLVAANRGATVGGGLPDPLSISPFLGSPDGTFSALAPVSVGIKTDALVTGLRRGRSDIGLVGWDNVPSVSRLNARVLLDQRTVACSPLPALSSQPIFEASQGGNETFLKDAVASDLNRDGRPDLIIIGSQANQAATVGSVFVYLGPGTGSAATGAFNTVQKTEYPVGFIPERLRTGDFDGDGEADILIANEGALTPFLQSSVMVLFGNGDGTFSPTTWTSTAAFRPFSLAVGDFNGDHIDDFAAGLTTGATGEIAIFSGNGVAGGRTAPFTYTGSTAAPGLTAVWGLEARDVNSDGILDLVAGGRSGIQGKIVVLLGTGTYPGPLL